MEIAWSSSRTLGLGAGVFIVCGGLSQVAGACPATCERSVSRGAPFVVLAAVALPYFIHLGTSSLWDANEAFYAETPREMLESGDYLAPRFNHQLRPQKPPLTYWLVLASYNLFGVSEFAVRLPGALAGGRSRGERGRPYG